MPIFDIEIVMQPRQTIYGLWQDSSDKTISKDIPSVSKKYHEVVGNPHETTLPFYVLSKDYDTDSGLFKLFVGGITQHPQLCSLDLPDGVYCKIIVKPKLGFLWGLAVGEAKRYFYTKWLPASEYAALNMEFEYHTNKSIGKKPEIELLFALEKTKQTSR